MAASLAGHAVLLLLLLNLARRPERNPEAGPAYQLVFDNGATPPAATKQTPQPAPAGDESQLKPPPAPPKPPAASPPGADALVGPQSNPAPFVPPVARPARETPPSAPLPAAPAEVQPNPPAPAPPPAPPASPDQADVPAAPENAEPSTSSAPAVRLAEPNEQPAPPPQSDFVAPSPPEPLPPLKTTSPRPSPPRPQTSPNPSTAGSFANPLDLNFGSGPKRLAAPRMTAAAGSVASRSLDLSPGAAKPDLNRQQAFFDARAAHVTADWGESLHAYWLRHRFYPRQAAENGEDGSVEVELTVNRYGQVEKVAIKSRSGSQWLDMAATSVWRGAKLPPLPDEAKGRTITFPITINYQLIR